MAPKKIEKNKIFEPKGDLVTWHNPGQQSGPLAPPVTHLALRDSAVVCKVLSAASSGTMNHFAATREEQVEALQLLQKHRKAESVQEALDLVLDSGCFASL